MPLIGLGFLFRLDISIDLPEIPLPDLPEIPSPSLDLPDLPDLPAVPGWIRAAILEAAEYRGPLLAAVVIGIREYRSARPARRRAAPARQNGRTAATGTVKAGTKTCASGPIASA